MKINQQIKKFNNIGSGGDAGNVFIAAKNIRGDGKITADGGSGSVGGKGGKITIISENNQFAGKISAEGGQSLNKLKWWEKSWIQAIILLSAIIGIIGFILLIL